MVAVDTNVLLRIFTRDDEKLAAAAEQLLHNAGTVLLDRIILAEFGYVLRSYYGYEKTDIAKMKYSLLNDERFTIPDRDLTELAVELFAAEKPLSFEDCWLLALQRRAKVDGVATLDHALQKRLR